MILNKGRLLGILLACGSLSLELHAAVAPGGDPLQKSLVKIFTIAQEPNYYEPWRVNSQQSMSGSGSIIVGKHIITNAHVVANAIFLQVQKDGDSKKYVARREYVADDCDLAMLTVDDPEFFKGTLPVSFGVLPDMRDRVAVYGYPLGGEELSITEGVVSRIEVSSYVHSLRNLIDVQTDAAINPGNSGGPVFKAGKMVGVAFQGYNGSVAQNIGYFVPIELVKRFLDEVKSGTYQGIPSLGVYTESMENPAIRAHFGMKEGQSGVLVSKVIYGSSAWGIVQENDVLLSLAGFPIANDRSISLRKRERINFSYPLDLLKIGDKVALKVLRQGQEMSLSVPMKEDVHLVPLLEYNKNPRYYIFDGLVFTPFNMNYPGVGDATPSELRELYLHGLPSPDRKEVVLLNHILSHEINKGYGPNYSNLIVTKVNGHNISELKDLIAAFKDPQNGRHVIEIDKPLEVGNEIVLDAKGSTQASQEILDEYGVPSDRSPDLAEAKP